jgi:hypothetical protein
MSEVVTPLEYLGAFAIGAIGSGVILFGSYVGLKSFEELPKKLFNPRNSIIYILLGGAIALILQLAFTQSFAPLYSLAVGVGWPALVIGLSTSQNAQQIVDAQMKEMQELLKKIQGGG